MIWRTPCVPAAHRGERHGDEEGYIVAKCGRILGPTTQSTTPHKRRWPSCRPSVSRRNHLAIPRRRRVRPPCRATAQNRSPTVIEKDPKRDWGPSTASVRSSTTGPDISCRNGNTRRGPGHVPERSRGRSRRPSGPRNGRTPAAPRAKAGGESAEPVDLGTRQTRGRLSRRGGARRTGLNSMSNLQVPIIGSQGPAIQTHSLPIVQ